MAWIESHQTLKSDPKLRRLCRALGISRREAIGALHELWWFALDHAEDGNLAKVDRRDLAVEMDFPEGEAERVWGALTEVGPEGEPGFVEDSGALHAWHRYAGRLIRDRVRKRLERKADASTDSPRSVRGRSEECPGKVGATVPYPTVPNPTVPKATETGGARPRFTPPTAEQVAAYCLERGGLVDAQKWRDHYASNGWKVGRNAMKDWKAAVRTWEKSDYGNSPGGAARGGRVVGAAAPTPGKYDHLG